LNNRKLKGIFWRQVKNKLGLESSRKYSKVSKTNFKLENSLVVKKIKLNEVLTQFGMTLDESQQDLTKPSSIENLGIRILHL